MAMKKQLQEEKNWGVSYGEMVRREFIKNRLNVVCLIFMVFLFAVAVLAPFLANDKPFVIRIDGQWRFPVFRDLHANDYCVFLAAAVGVFQLVLIRRNRRRIDPSIRGGGIVASSMY